MEVAPTLFFLKGDSWTRLGSDSSPYGLGKVRENVGCTFRAYLHMFFSMQNVSVYNLIVVGFFASINTYANDSHLQLCCINHMCASVCLPYRLRVEGRGKEGIHSFNLQENSLMHTESNSKQHTRVVTKMKSSWSFFTLYGNDHDLKVKLNSRVSR